MLKSQLLSGDRIQVLVDFLGFEGFTALGALPTSSVVGNALIRFHAVVAEDDLAVDALVRVDRNTVAENTFKNL